MKKCLVVLIFALSVVASPAEASVTLGQRATTSSDVATVSSAAEDRLQPTVTSGNGYVVPATGGVTAWTVTSWSTYASPDAVQMAMKMFRKAADAASFSVVGHDGPRFLTPGVNTFPASIAVKAGDVLGVGYPADANVAPCCFFATGEHFLSREGFLADGQSGDFNSLSDLRVNVTAVLEPTNSFTLAGVKRKDNGTAIVTANLPNAGELTASGKGVKASSAGAVSAKQVSAGAARLKIKAKGRRLGTLNATGKVKLKVRITYTPTGGSPSSQKLKIRLHKR